jgi:hypothetical protein
MQIVLSFFQDVLPRVFVLRLYVQKPTVQASAVPVLWANSNFCAGTFILKKRGRTLNWGWRSPSLKGATRRSYVYLPEQVSVRLEKRSPVHLVIRHRLYFWMDANTQKLRNPPTDCHLHHCDSRLINNIVCQGT